LPEECGLHTFSRHLFAFVAGSIQQPLKQGDGSGEVFHGDPDMFYLYHVVNVSNCRRFCHSDELNADDGLAHRSKLKEVISDLPVYLDYHATTPLDPEVLEKMLPWMTRSFGNASSRQHAYGRMAGMAVTVAREQVAEAIGAGPSEIVFTSGATESVNLAIKGAAEAYATKGRHIITCATEHPAVLDVCRSLGRSGYEITLLEVDGQGRLDPESLRSAIRPDTILAALMLANNETGVIHDVLAFSAICRERGVILFTDATQALGKIPVNVEDLGVDMLCLSAHKFMGPKGVGALYVRRRAPRVRLVSQIDGGGHESGLRSGTLNVPGIVGLGAALSLAVSRMETEMPRIGRLRDRLELQLLVEEECFVNAGKTLRLPTVSNISFRFVEGQALLGAVSRDVALSTGSACSSALMEPSHVLTAMGLGRELAYASLRISLGIPVTEEDIDRAALCILEKLREMRQSGQLWQMYRQGMLKGHPGWRHPDALEDLSQ
jgi:cysteine desulfurase